MIEDSIIQARIAYRTSRLKTELDGPGVRTLVPFTGCHLRCKWCINKDLTGPDAAGEIMTPEELYEELKIDDIYFRASGGGITFGGGEPLLHADFIKRFCEICPEEWSIAVETSLNVPLENVRLLKDVVDLWIVDVKDMNPEIYLKYTEQPIDLMRNNLNYLVDNGLKDKILARVPHILEFNTPDDVEASLEALNNLGIEGETFYYKIDRDEQPTMGVHYNPKKPSKWPQIIAWIFALPAIPLSFFFIPNRILGIIGSIALGALVGYIAYCIATEVVNTRERKRTEPPLMGEIMPFPPEFDDDNYVDE